MVGGDGTLGAWAVGGWGLELMLDASVKGAVLLVLAWGLTLALRRAGAAARQWVWVLALGGLVLLPGLSAMLPGWRVLPEWVRVVAPVAHHGDTEARREGATEGQSDGATKGGRGGTDSAAAVEGRSGREGAGAGGGMVVGSGDAAGRGEIVGGGESTAAGAVKVDAGGTMAARTDAAGPAEKRAKLGWGAWVVGRWMWIWGAGVVACLLPVGLGWVSLWRLRRRARVISHHGGTETRRTGGEEREMDGDIEGNNIESWGELVGRVCGRLGLGGRGVVVLMSGERTMPMVGGLWRAKLLLPAEAAEWSAGRREAVVVHELAHVKRWDCLTKLVGHVACAAYWFNPLAWWAFRELQREAEGACDDLVVASGQAPSEYAGHLVEVAAGLRSGMLVAHNSIAMARGRGAARGRAEEAGAGDIGRGEEPAGADAGGGVGGVGGGAGGGGGGGVHAGGGWARAVGEHAGGWDLVGEGDARSGGGDTGGEGELCTRGGDEVGGVGAERGEEGGGGAGRAGDGVGGAREGWRD